MVSSLTSSAIVIDTSAVIALTNPSDKFYQQSQYFFENTRNVLWILLNATTHETFTRLRYNIDLKTALNTYDWLRTKQFRIINFDMCDEKEARALLQKYKDQKFSFHDALCAAMMIRIGMFRIFTFDSDFWIMGFQVEPGITSPNIF